MNKDALNKDLKNCVDNKTPLDYFNKLTDVLSYLCNKIERLEGEVAKARITSALAIKWDSRFALAIIEDQIEFLRNNDIDFYKSQIDELKKAYKEDLVTQSYDTFCAFWQDVNGVHPFMHYED
jgi:hypothetical protein